MLKPSYIEHLPDSLVDLYAQAEADILADMARRISTYNYYIPAAEHQLKKLEQMGMVRDEITSKLSGLTGKTEKEIKTLMKEAGVSAVSAEDVIYRANGMNPPPLKASPGLQSILEAGHQKTSGAFQNLTMTTAGTASRQFEHALDRAWLQITTGAFDSDAAIRNVIKDLSSKGIAVIQYPSGKTDYMETAVRRAVITGVNSTHGRLIEARREQMGANLVEVTAHAGARPEHAEWQGGVYWTQYSDPDYPLNFYDTCGYGEGSGIYGWNCSHSHRVYFKGSPRAYSPELLEEYEAKNYEYNGRRMTEAEAVSRQREIERNIRKWKREYQAMSAAGQSTAESAAKIARWQDIQRDYLQQTGLKRNIGREQIGGYGKSQAQKVVWQNRKAAESAANLVGRIDVSNHKLVQLTIKEFEKSVVSSPVENALVILKDGNMYRFVGDKSSVNPEVLGNQLSGSTITHNHPAGSGNEYSFSSADIELFKKYEVETLRGIDEKFIYEISRRYQDVEPFAKSVFDLTEYDGRLKEIQNKYRDEET